MSTSSHIKDAEKEIVEKRKKPVSTILVSQPEPQDKNSQYFRLADRYNIKFDFRPFIEVVPVDAKEFRQQKVNILNHTAVIFTSRHGVDFFFALCMKLKVEIPSTMKYFCISEQMSNYLQKYITVRKRKTYSGSRTAKELIEILKGHPDENFFHACSETSSKEIPDFLESNDYQHTNAIIHRTVSSDLSDLTEVSYDIIAFFSPTDIKSLFSNFPSFKQNDTRIAGFGLSTCNAIREHGLIVDIEAPMPDAPSMTGAIELYIKAERS
ncbi:MAG: uroporphyrinogen-III synthase [Cyclobacteriaceae bacterium]|jgi:uroporphyrinogen-III synthase